MDDKQDGKGIDRTYLQGFFTGALVAFAIAAVWFQGSEYRARRQVRAAFDEVGEQWRDRLEELKAQRGAEEGETTGTGLFGPRE